MHVGPTRYHISFQPDETENVDEEREDGENGNHSNTCTNFNLPANIGTICYLCNGETEMDTVRTSLKQAKTRP